MNIFIRGTIAGIISGTILGLFLKAIEQTVGTKVYTLLLNVDYIPYVKDLTLSEPIEFIMHLIISIILGIGLLYLVKRNKWSNREILIRVTIISFVIGILLYPTTALSVRTPSITSIEAIVFWLIGHIGYGSVLGSLLFRK
ncbi:phosphoglycerol transferase MdoB-like AlkP superfamily enzyme [Bacillus mesophilus]|uniref:DUF1440 domain-containing protein n=1 Tax=Bacillus mesophilus TaxID=1808955 RepID=A0A6M0QD75_9BACI|nr:hypothetical protein [Bacillus mesophilus]MBM7662332.1 phosphoglycerol transferase MdoB-like AlkP superfamily enzyme [Bacillus mesophilus]NEY73038.1 hypothetical protein [Bacillus mesophilus]